MGLGSPKVTNTLSIFALILSGVSMLISLLILDKQSGTALDLHAMNNRLVLSFADTLRLASAEIADLRGTERAWANYKEGAFGLKIVCKAALRNDSDSPVRIWGTLLTDASEDADEIRRLLCSGDRRETLHVQPPMSDGTKYMELARSCSSSVSPSTQLQMVGRSMDRTLLLFVFYGNELGLLYDVSARVRLVDHQLLEKSKEWFYRFGSLPSSLPLGPEWVTLETINTSTNYYNAEDAAKALDAIKRDALPTRSQKSP